MPQRRLPAAVLAAACALLVLAPGAAPAQAADPSLPPVTVTEADVAAAQARVDAVSRQVTVVAVQLGDGTARWVQGRTDLEAARAQAAAAQARADAAEAFAVQRRRVLAGFVAANYRSPASSPLLLKAGGGSTGLLEALRADADLHEVRGNQQDALADAQAAGRTAAQAEEQATALRDSAAERERELAADLASLQALADRTDAQLSAAVDELDRLQAERADQLAKREAARLAAEQAAREAAARALARAAAVPAPRSPSTPGAGPGSGAGSCSGRSTGGYANGTIPASALCPLLYAPGHRLRADAAAAFNRLTEAARAARGAPLCVTDSYRSYSEQVRLYKEKPGLAAIPGTSNHGWGVAVDLCGGVQDYGTPAYVWMKANAPRFGWVHPAWAEPGGSRQEPWHWEFVG